MPRATAAAGATAGGARCAIGSRGSAAGRSARFSRPLGALERRRGTVRQRPGRAVAALLVVEPRTLALVPVDAQLAKAQAVVLEAISDVTGRGKGGLGEGQKERFELAVALLEASGGVPDPTVGGALDGRWRLLFTTRSGTASPIQRTFTGVEGFTVYQDIQLTGEGPARVDNVVDFGPSIGFLRVEAEANTDVRPIPGFTPRKGKGLPFGLLGVSSTERPKRPNMRIDFQFDRAAFNFRRLPFPIPYPVPFRRLGDERKGWLDVTYLSPDGRFRLSRGNKGTLFILTRDSTPRERLLEALALGAEDSAVEELAAELEAAQQEGEDTGGEAAPARSPLAAGTWRLRWSKQGARANPFQQALAGQVENFQIITPEGRLENLVCLPGGLRVRACAACEPESDTRTSVNIDDVVLEAGSLRVPLPIKADGPGYVDWYYLDNDLRVTRGNKGSLFVHTRES